MGRGNNTRARGSFRGSFRGSRGGRGRGRGQGSRTNAGSNGSQANAALARDDEGTQLAERFENVKLNDDVEERLGFVRVQEGPRKEGWLINMHPVRF